MKSVKPIFHVTSSEFNIHNLKKLKRERFTEDLTLKVDNKSIYSKDNEIKRKTEDKRKIVKFIN